MSGLTIAGLKPEGDLSRRLLPSLRKLPTEALLVQLEPLVGRKSQDELKAAFAERPSVYSSLEGLREGGELSVLVPTDEQRQVARALWERLLPESPSLEAILEDVEMGYQLSRLDRSASAATTWLTAWKQLRELMNRANLRGLEGLAAQFQREESLYRFMDALQLELSNAAQREMRYHQERVAWCAEVLDTFSTPVTTIYSIRIALADAFFSLGECSHADALYEEWLEREPSWGGGWIGWSDLYWFWGRLSDDRRKAERLLKRGLSIESVSDRRGILERLAALYKEMRRTADARAIRAEIRALSSSTPEILS